METKKIFNIRQADVFIKNGLVAVGCGLGNKDKTYIEFEQNSLFRDLLTKYLNKQLY